MEGTRQTDMVHCFMPLVEAFYHAADHASSTQKHDTIRILITIYAPDDVSSTGYAIYSHATEWLVIAGPPPPPPAPAVQQPTAVEREEEKRSSSRCVINKGRYNKRWRSARSLTSSLPH